MDLDAYLRRIGYDGPREATLPALRRLHACHALSIPFENIDVLCGRRIDIGLEAVERKLVGAHRGGYCFEHATLMLHAYRALGFQVTPLIARIRWQVAADVLTNLGHMRLRVRVGEADFIADAGLGSATLLEPIALAEDTEQATRLDRRRLVRQGKAWLEQVNFGDGWGDVCTFSADEALQPDFELGNWYYCTHPDSLFVRNLVVARPGENARYSVMNREFSVRTPGGPTVRQAIESPRHLESLLDRYFGLRVPHGVLGSLRCLEWDKAAD